MPGRYTVEKSSSTTTLFTYPNTTFFSNHSFFKLQSFQLKMQFSIFSTGFLVAIMASSALAAPSTFEKRIKAVSSKVHVEISCS
jgi:hypothetical protein